MIGLYAGQSKRTKKLMKSKLEPGIIHFAPPSARASRASRNASKLRELTTVGRTAARKARAEAIVEVGRKVLKGDEAEKEEL